MDGKHVRFKASRESGSYYYNYKGYNSIVLLGVVDANYRFLFVDVGCNGRISDGGVYSNSALSSALSKNTINFPAPSTLPGSNIVSPYTLVADSAFQLQTNIMKPYPSPACIEEKIFNYRLSRARRVVENAFGILSNRFRVLLTSIGLSPSKVEQVVLASCALHNFLIDENASGYCSLDRPIDTNEVTEISQCNLASVHKFGSNRGASKAYEVRSNLCKFFNNVGTVPWQWDSVRKFNF